MIQQEVVDGGLQTSSKYHEPPLIFLDDIRGSPRDLAGKTYARWGGAPRIKTKAQQNNAMASTLLASI